MTLLSTKWFTYSSGAMKKRLYFYYTRPSIVQGVLLDSYTHAMVLVKRLDFLLGLLKEISFLKSFVQGLGGRSWFFAIKGWNNALLKEMCTLWFPLESGSHNK